MNRNIHRGGAGAGLCLALGLSFLVADGAHALERQAQTWDYGVHGMTGSLTVTGAGERAKVAINTVNAHTGNLCDFTATGTLANGVFTGTVPDAPPHGRVIVHFKGDQARVTEKGDLSTFLCGMGAEFTGLYHQNK